jgi:hypothetical protein
MNTHDENVADFAGTDKPARPITKTDTPEPADTYAFEDIVPEARQATMPEDSSMQFDDGFITPEVPADAAGSGIEHVRLESLSEQKGMTGFLRASRQKAMGRFKALFHRDA